MVPSPSIMCRWQSSTVPRDLVLRLVVADPAGVLHDGLFSPGADAQVILQELASLREASGLELFDVRQNGRRVDVRFRDETGSAWLIVVWGTQPTPDSVDSVQVHARPHPFSGRRHGLVVVLNGPSSVGKSTLMRTFAERAVNAIRVLGRAMVRASSRRLHRVAGDDGSPRRRSPGRRGGEPRVWASRSAADTAISPLVVPRSKVRSLPAPPGARGSLAASIDAIAGELGPLHSVFANAAILPPPLPVEDLDWAGQVHRVLAVNLTCRASPWATWSPPRRSRRWPSISSPTTHAT